MKQSTRRYVFFFQTLVLSAPVNKSQCEEQIQYDAARIEEALDEAINTLVLPASVNKSQCEQQIVREMIVKLAAKDTAKAEKKKILIVNFGIDSQVVVDLFENSNGNNIFTDVNEADVNQAHVNKVKKQIGVLKLATVMHKLYNHAANNGKVFERGSFSIEDPQGDFFNKLKKLADKSIPGQYVYPKPPSKSKSSYYKGSDNQYGIDIVFDASDNPINILPYGMHHILFGYVNEDNEDTVPKTFIKCESYGLATWSDTVNHGIELFKTFLENKENIAGPTRREKDLPSELKEVIDKHIKILCEAGLDVKFKVKEFYNHHNLVEKILNEEKKNTEQDSFELIDYNNLVNSDPKLKKSIEDIHKVIVNITGGNPNIAKIQSGNEYVINANEAKKFKEILDFNID